MKKLITYLIITALFFIGSISSTAIESRYKNNLLNVELSQTPDNRVSVLLVFEKPYTDPIKVIYKTDNEYNILLPETYNALSTVSSINSLNVRNANVKLVPYFNQDNSNGYTKISIKTTRPVIFNAHSSYITTQIAKDDLIDKLERDDSLQLAENELRQKHSTTYKRPAKSTKYRTSKKYTTAKKPVNKTTKQIAYNKPAQPDKNQETLNPVLPTAQQAQKIPPLVTEPMPDVKPISPDNNAIQQPISAETATTKPVSENITEKKHSIKNISKQAIKRKVLNTARAVKNNKYTPLLALIALIILLGALLSKLLKTATKRYQKQTSHKIYLYDEDKSVIPEEIKDLSWQEKYKYMKDQEEAQRIADKQREEALRKQNIENLYSISNDAQAVNAPQTQIATAQTQQFPETDPNTYDIYATSQPNDTPEPETLAPQAYNFNDISDIEPAVDEMYSFAPDKENLEASIESDIEINETYASKPIEPTLINQAKISKTKGFYLIRYENEVALVGYIKDEIFFIHSFSNMDQSFVHTRLTEKKKGADIYLVRSDNYKALVSVSKDKMQPLINL